jgi:hypothetical protein
MKVDFRTMSIGELKAYVLANRQDDAAFSCLVERLESDEGEGPLYPAPTTPETVAVMERAMQERFGRR